MTGRHRRHGHTHKCGVEGLNAFIGKDLVWCLTEARSADMFHKSHEAGYGLNISEGNVGTVQTLV